ncbi:MAG: cation transporter [Clostridia bacterium]|nr:cation transporter [Clostridia bacterium]
MREKTIVRTSMVGIGANVLLVTFKAIVGIISNSIAVILDAVNNLSDALSSVVTIIGTKLAARKPDKKHPLGHGRIEYLAAMIVSAIVLYAGIASLVESIKKIIDPVTPDYSVWTLIVISSAVVIKLLLGRYVKRVGKKVNSASLVASGSDALFDALISVSVLVSTVIFLIWGVNLEAYVGVLISGFIIKAGIGMLLETFDDILGKRADRDFVEEIKKTVCEDEAVSGAFDLMLHNYGPDKYIGSVHVEIPDTMSADEIDRMERRIARNVFLKHGVVMAGIGIYSMNTKDDEVNAIRSKVVEIVNSHEGVLQIHGFYADLEHKTISLDVILDFELKDREAVYHHIKGDIEEAFPEYKILMTMDIDI